MVLTFEGKAQMRVQRIGAAACVAVLVLAGCSSDPETGSATAPDAGTSAPAKAAPAPAAPEEPDAIETGPNTTEPSPTEAMTMTVVGVVVETGEFHTLAAALDVAGLVETLGGEGPYTLFAPTDEAFDAMPSGALDALLLPENEEVLREVLSYHVLPGEVPSADMADGNAATVQGESVTLNATDDVSVNDTTVIRPNVSASNGVVHVIDEVLVPPSIDVSAL